MSIKSADDFYTLLCAFPSVKYLTFGFVSFPQSILAAFPSPPQELRLETLDLRFYYNFIHSAMPFLQEGLSEILEDLKHLRVAHMTNRELQLVKLILCQTRESLISAYIGPMMLGNAESQQHTNDPILLLSLSHVKYLTVVIGETDPYTSTQILDRDLLETFSTDDENFKLKEFTTNLKVHVERSDSSLSASFPSVAQWSALDAALSRSQMKELCGVNLNLTVDSGSGYDPQLETLFARVRGIIEDSCKSLMSRDLLRVDK